MGIFKDYSKYYNVLYKDKNYKAETDYVIDLIKQFNPEANSILNLGCGTGSHDFIFANKGFDITAVDLSYDMIDVANAKKKTNTTIAFLQGDMRSIRLNKRVDVVLSLFHVMSYQTTNEDLSNAMQTAHSHLKKDGLFIFDCWYGPGVLTDRPSVRNKTFEDEDYLAAQVRFKLYTANHHKFITISRAFYTE